MESDIWKIPSHHERNEMHNELRLEDGEYPFIAERLPLSDLAWIEVPASLEALLRDQAHANGVQLIRGEPIELRCQTAVYGDAVFMIFWPHKQDRLHMLAPKKFQMGRA
jgi:hypothetical protein